MRRSFLPAALRVHVCCYQVWDTRKLPQLQALATHSYLSHRDGALAASLQLYVTQSQIPGPPAFTIPCSTIHARNQWHACALMNSTGVALQVWLAGALPRTPMQACQLCLHRRPAPSQKPRNKVQSSLASGDHRSPCECDASAIGKTGASSELATQHPRSPKASLPTHSP
jgi:hypothetical protein